jgi:hypothetical protein
MVLRLLRNLKVRGGAPGCRAAAWGSPPTLARAQWTGLASALSLVAARLESGVKADLLPLMAMQPHLARGFPVPVSMLRGGESAVVGGSGEGTGGAQTVTYYLPRLSVRR